MHKRQCCSRDDAMCARGAKATKLLYLRIHDDDDDEPLSKIFIIYLCASVCVCVLYCSSTFTNI